MNDDTSLEQRLRDARPEPAPDALDRVHTRLSRLRARRAQRRSSMLMATLLAVGIVGTGSGGALAVSGLSATGTAAQVQYPVVQAPSSNAGTPTTTPSLGGNEAESVSPSDTKGNTSSPKETAPSADVVAQTVQAGNQTAAAGSSDNLPLTGFLAIPILLLGLASLGAGLVLRIRTRRSAD